ncbi:MULTISPECIES: hypothetical protein [Micromonospora]|uniref:Uncharacterized protein n=1 Tax=Micromonospora yangpuensis TaxID=683228 RepID=A0A1C6UV02_9ACTN|nr:hypothetical protein [Micromonospora yangpuensis]GGM23646.1 hypothetical protein GCM10012279_47400 [Micromonospora yangpuensis]SCL57904.1 hypothetical protein GA0070617_3660 [Micromonospora yangpuensis]
MTGPNLSLAQIHNRLILTARQILRQHEPEPDGRCPTCRSTGCRIADAARDVIRTVSQVRLWRVGTAPTTGDPDNRQQQE